MKNALDIYEKMEPSPSKQATLNHLIAELIKQRNIPLAKTYLSQLSENPDIITLSSFLHYYSNQGHEKGVQNILLFMKQNNIKLDLIGYNILLHHYSKK